MKLMNFAVNAALFTAHFASIFPDLLPGFGDRVATASSLLHPRGR